MSFVSPVPEPAVGAAPPGVSREIYGMPFFATLLASDIERTVGWFTEALGFIILFSMPGADGSPVVVHLRRWHFQDILVRPAGGPCDPGQGCTISVAAVYDELADLASRARAHGAGRVDGPTDTLWNTRDLLTTDPDGYRVLFTAARPPGARDDQFNETLTRLGREQASAINIKPS